MIEEAITRVEKLTTEKLRKPVLDLQDGSNRLYLYNDKAQKYEEVDRWAPSGYGVSNVESFATLVKEAARRKENPTGNLMTVIFSATGATFAADDRDRRDLFAYDRTNSPQWKALLEILNKPMDHPTFVRALQRLRPSIKDYDRIIRHYRKVSFGETLGIVSEPILTDGKSQNAYQVAIEARGGAENTTTLPSEFVVELQFTRGSSSRYLMTIELDLSTIPKGDRKELRFTLIAPEVSVVVEQAIEDEVAWFRGEAKDLSELLILVDY